VAVPGIVLWGVTAPLLALFYLRKSGKRLLEADTIAKYGFIYKGFRTKYYFWEIYILFRKILFISAAVFLNNINRTIQALVSFAIVLIAYRIHELHHPYVTKALNGLEVRSLAVALITIYCGLYFLTEDIDYTTQICLLIMLILANLYFFLYWVIKLAERLPSYLKQKKPQLYKKLECILVPGSRGRKVRPSAQNKKVKVAILPSPDDVIDPEESERPLPGEMSVELDAQRVFPGFDENETLKGSLFGQFSDASALTSNESFLDDSQNGQKGSGVTQKTKGNYFSQVKN